MAEVADRSDNLAMWTDPKIRDDVWKAANRMAASQLVPVAYRNKPEDCMVAMELADILGVRTIAVLQNVSMVHGSPTFKATFATTLANQRGPFKHPIRYRVEGEGASLKVTAWSTMRDTDEVVEAYASMEMARLEKWDKNPKYQSMPEQMLHYRAATFLIRRHCPDILFGFHLTDEVEDIHASGQTYGGAPQAASTPEQSCKIEDLNQEITDVEVEPVEPEKPKAPPAPEAQQQHEQPPQAPVSDDPF